MHLVIRNDIRFRFATPARNVTFLLRLSPRSHEGQHVTETRIEPNIDCSLKAGQDAFGNVTHSFSAAGPLDEFSVSSTCTVETFDAAGLVRGGAERLPVDLYLRDSDLTTVDPALRQFAERATAAEAQPLGKMHALLQALHAEIGWAVAEVAGAGSSSVSAAAAFAAKSAGAEGHAHAFAAAARHLGVPCRFVSGYLLRRGGRTEGSLSASHAWAEAHVTGLGWIGFDTAENICPNGRHVRVATGLDALGSAFVRGTPCDDTSAKAVVVVV